jgi:hypothetical protein
MSAVGPHEQSGGVCRPKPLPFFHNGIAVPIRLFEAFGGFTSLKI